MNQILHYIQKDLAGLAFNLTGNREDMKDLIQETCLRMLTYKERYADHPEEHLRKIANVAMKNIFIDSTRRKLYDPKTLPLFENCDKVVKPDYDEKIFLKEVDEFMVRSENNHVKALRMFSMGYQLKDIQKEFGVGINTAVGYLHYARKTMKKRFPEIGNYIS